jgi:putative FmdB family regulatory protein
VPTYSYACTDCDDRFDAVQTFSDDALTTCNKCEGRLRKLFNSVGVVFKGSGFYRNDSRDSSKTSSGSSAGTSSSSEKSSTEKSSTEKSSTEKSSSTVSSPAPAAAASS